MAILIENRYIAVLRDPDSKDKGIKRNDVEETFHVAQKMFLDKHGNTSLWWPTDTDIKTMVDSLTEIMKNLIV